MTISFTSVLSQSFDVDALMAWVDAHTDETFAVSSVNGCVYAQG